MKVLIGHNYYRTKNPSGETEVLKVESEMLRTHGHEVSYFTRHSDDLLKFGKLAGAKASLVTSWNPRAYFDIRKKVDELKPNVFHVHNTFPLMSPSVFPAVSGRVARVLTLHNYRLFCPSAMPMREGAPCTKCIDTRNPIYSVIHGCYRGSRVASVPVAFSVALHRALGTWKEHVDAFIALTDFQKDLMIMSGLPEEKVHVKPNFYPGLPVLLDWKKRQPYVVFVGRLSAEKGVRTLISAWRKWGESAPMLHVLGDGELKEELLAASKGLNVKFFGQVSSEEVQRQVSNSKLMVLPSEWFEGFPMVIREAFAFGTPVAVSNIGPLTSIVEENHSGINFEPANAESLMHGLKNIWFDSERLELLGEGARREFESKYSEKTNYKALMDIYECAIDMASRCQR